MSTGKQTVILWKNLLLFFLKEKQYVIKKFYLKRFSFLLSDLLLGFIYFFRNPYPHHRKYYEKKGCGVIAPYGETPLSSWEVLMAHADMTSEDVFVELGCGRGKGCFFLANFAPCTVIGVEKVPFFIKAAQLVSFFAQTKRVLFCQRDFLAKDLPVGTVFYLYGTCMEEKEITLLAQKLSCLKENTKIITVSYPLSDYAQGFEMQKTFPLRFNWGGATAYLQTISRK